MGSRNSVIDLANWAPPQRPIKDAKGRVVLEKISPLLSRKVVDLDGNVVLQPAANGIANRSPQDPYGLQTHHEKLYGRPRMLKGTPGGIIPYAKCPQSLGVPHVLEDCGIPMAAPCTAAHNGRPISNADACACVVEIIRVRQAAAKARNDEAEERMNKQIKMQERTAEANLDAANQMAEAAKALAAAAAAQGRGKKDNGQ